MLRDTISIDRVLEVLNRAVEADRDAIEDLVASRVPCNDELAADPEIQVGIYHIGSPTVGVLGLINGFFGNQDGWGAISATFGLRCAADESHEIKDSKAVVEGCPECGASVITGKLIEFIKTPAI